MQSHVSKPKNSLRLIMTAALFLSALIGCVGEQQETHPLTRPHYPSGLAISGNTLAVLSMNFDRRFTSGALLTVDLDKVENELQKLGSVPPASRFISGDAVVTSSAFVPSLARQTIALSGAATGTEPAPITFIFQNRDQETIQAVPLNRNTGTIRCARPATMAAADVLGQDCREAAGILKLSGREPYTMAALPKEPGDTGFPKVAVAYLGSDQIDVVEFNANGLPARVAATVNLLALVDKSDLHKNVGAQVMRMRIRSLKTLTKGQGGYAGESIVLAALEFKLSVDTSFLDPTAARVVWFPVAKLLSGQLQSSDLGEWNLTKQINSKGVSDVEAIAENGKVRLYALLTKTDAIVAADFNAVPGGKKLQSASLRRILDTCDNPLQITYVPSQKTLVVGCRDTMAQASLRLVDPATLEPTHIVNRFGRGMEAFAVSPERNRVYVSYGTNGTVGILSTEDGKLEIKGHIFPNAPRNLPGGL
jgi:hypothetical protein